MPLSGWSELDHLKLCGLQMLPRATLQNTTSARIIQEHKREISEPDDYSAVSLCHVCIVTLHGPTCDTSPGPVVNPFSVTTCWQPQHEASGAGRNSHPMTRHKRHYCGLVSPFRCCVLPSTCNTSLRTEKSLQHHNTAIYVDGYPLFTRVPKITGQSRKRMRCTHRSQPTKEDAAENFMV